MGCQLLLPAVHWSLAACHQPWPCYLRDHFVYAPSQWETTLQCNVVSHWLGAYTKWSLLSMCSQWLHCFSLQWLLVLSCGDRAYNGLHCLAFFRGAWDHPQSSAMPSPEYELLTVGILHNPHVNSLACAFHIVVHWGQLHSDESLTECRLDTLLENITWDNEETTQP